MKKDVSLLIWAQHGMGFPQDWETRDGLGFPQDWEPKPCLAQMRLVLQSSLGRMNSLKICLQIPSALLECCELAAHLRIPASKTEEMKKKLGRWLLSLVMFISIIMTRSARKLPGFDFFILFCHLCFCIIFLFNSNKYFLQNEDFHLYQLYGQI